tara:strand:+ start:1566 stop:2258 length:693 start_codon:yes stop_codon:yes gene_type:complete
MIIGIVLLASNGFAIDIEVDFELLPAEPYYLGSTIETIKINAFYTDGSRVTAADLGTPTLYINQERLDLDLETDETGAAVANINYKIELNEEFVRNRNTTLFFDLKDLMRETGGAPNVNKRADVEDSHPELKLRIKNPPSFEPIFHNLEIPFEIELTKSENVQNEKVYLVDERDLDNKRECDKVKEENGKAKFECLEKIPSMDEVDRLVYVAFAEAEVGGQAITLFEISE